MVVFRVLMYLYNSQLAFLSSPEFYSYKSLSCTYLTLNSKLFSDLIYHVPFQRYFNCENPQIKNFTKVQVVPLKKFKLKKKLFCHIYVCSYDGKKKKEYSIMVHLFIRKPYHFLINFDV